jgi:serine/threonine protein kinase
VLSCPGGEDLASLLRRIGRLPQDKGIEVARQICAGLHAAHERGVVHRDLKPANVMLDERGASPVSGCSRMNPLAHPNATTPAITEDQGREQALAGRPMFSRSLLD